MFVSIKGSPHARLRRALLTGNMAVIEGAAAELPALDLADALRVLIVMGKVRDPRYERAAARWAARAASERRLSLADSRRVLALVEALPESPDAVGEALARLCSTAGG